MKQDTKEPEDKSNTTVKINLKYYFMSTAEVVDAFRGIPRLLVAGYCYLVWVTVNWFMNIPEPTSQHTFLISTIVGGAAAVFGLYVNSGSGWDRKTARKDSYIEYHPTGLDLSAKTPYKPERQRPEQRPARWFTSGRGQRNNERNTERPTSRRYQPDEVDDMLEDTVALSAADFSFESAPATGSETPPATGSETPPASFLNDSTG